MSREDLLLIMILFAVAVILDRVQIWYLERCCQCDSSDHGRECRNCFPPRLPR